MKNFAYVFLFVFTIACRKKSPPPPLSSEKRITAFQLKSLDNPGILSADILGIIGSGDTIKLGVPQGTPLGSLVPSVTYKGKSISPQSGIAQNFSTFVYYTVTAEDGTTRKYTVVVKQLSNAKEITSFQFRAADNAGAVAADITGVIRNDSIFVNLPYTTAINTLKPYITYIGETLFAASGTAQDFSQVVPYVVTAEDGSSRRYVVIVRTNLSVFFSSLDGYIYALDATTGKLQWKFATGQPARCTPVLDNGVLYANAGANVYALDATTGAKLWSAATVYGTSGSPYVHNGVVFVCSGGPSAYTLHALDAANGNTKWTSNAGYTITANPVADGQHVIIGDAGFGTLAFNLGDGSPAWSYGSGITRGGAAIVNGTVFIGGEAHKLIKLDAATGQFRAGFIDGGFGSGTAPTIANGTAYVGSYDGHMVAIDTGTMTLKWKYRQANSRDFSSPVVAGDIVYAGNTDSYLYAVDANTGNTKWMFGSGHRQDPGIEATNPTVANGIVFCGSFDNHFYALNAATGAIKWSFDTGGPVYAGSCVVDATGKVTYAGTSGHKQ